MYPRIPGPEVIGRIDAVGPEVARWRVGDRVGVGWHGGHCGWCDPCRRGLFFACATATRVIGITADGGYADAMIARAEALAAVPDGLSAADAAPLMCAGLTTFNALRNSGARPGDVVAVLGVGGLGHLGVQYAARMGFRTVAIARGRDKKVLAIRRAARVVLATVTDGPAMTATVGGLGPDGTLMVLGVPPSLEVSPFALIAGRRAVQGWYSGASIDAQDTLAFSARSGVRSMNEPFPLERAPEAYERMLSGAARFRVVLTTGS